MVQPTHHVEPPVTASTKPVCRQLCWYLMLRQRNAATSLDRIWSANLGPNCTSKPTGRAPLQQSSSLPMHLQEIQRLAPTACHPQEHDASGLHLQAQQQVPESQTSHAHCCRKRHTPSCR